MKVTNCCGALFYEQGYPDNDICSVCKEHADAIEEEKPKEVKVPDIHRRGYISKKEKTNMKHKSDKDSAEEAQSQVDQRSFEDYLKSKI